MQIYQYQKNNPNAGYLKRMLGDFHKSIDKYKTFEPYNDAEAMLSMVVNIALRNPDTYSVCAAIISKLLFTSLNANGNTVILGDYVARIRKRFSAIPNTRLLDLWLQRIAPEIMCEYDCELAKLASAVFNEMPYPRNEKVWNSTWVEDPMLKEIINSTPIVDYDELKKMPRIVPPSETALYLNKGYE
jgi:hypothetical protein